MNISESCSRSPTTTRRTTTFTCATARPCWRSPSSPTAPRRPWSSSCPTACRTWSSTRSCWPGCWSSTTRWPAATSRWWATTSSSPTRCSAATSIRATCCGRSPPWPRWRTTTTTGSWPGTAGRRPSSASRTPAAGAGVRRWGATERRTRCLPRRSPLVALDRGLGLAVELARLLGLPLVVELLALDQGDLHLDPIPLEVQGEGHHGQPLELGAAEEPLDLPLLEQQPAHPLRILVLAVAVAVRADVGADEVRLPVPEFDVAVLELHPPLAHGFHLGAGQLDARLEGLQHLIVVPRPLVARQGAHRVFGLGRHAGEHTPTLLARPARPARPIRRIRPMTPAKPVSAKPHTYASANTERGDFQLALHDGDAGTSPAKRALRT